MKAAVIIFPGSNCDHDAYHAFKKVLDCETEFVWHKETSLDGKDLIILPGGFSYGDYLRSGAIACFSPVMKAVVEQAKKGIHVLGICNGFQILTESNLLPGALLRNENRQFVCEDIFLRVENNNSSFTSLCDAGEVLTVPIAHGDGNYYCDSETLSRLQSKGQIVFRYTTAEGHMVNKANPNGSLDNIAGVINEQGNVLGMMPHPERRVESVVGGENGLKILRSIVQHLSGN